MSPHVCAVVDYTTAALELDNEQLAVVLSEILEQAPRVAVVAAVVLLDAPARRLLRAALALGGAA